MRTGRRINSGAQLGIDAPVTCDVAFLYDQRGARTSPAIEVQEWIDPPVVGSPYAHSYEVGIQALGFSVRQLDQLRPLLRKGGATGSDVALPAAVTGGARAELWRDAAGVGMDLVEDGNDEARIRHVRITCRDLGASVAWYRRLGFRTLWDVTGDRMKACALRLPDEACELVLTEWLDPPSVGAGYPEANHLGWYRLAVGVDDLDASFRTLVDGGWEFTSPPSPTELEGTPLPPLWIAFTRDPDGIPVELVERPRAVFR